jgi:hypothetical protein
MCHPLAVRQPEEKFATVEHRRQHSERVRYPEIASRALDE